MLSLTAIDGDSLELNMEIASPSIYLDQWALVTFSKDLNLGRKFIEFLKYKRGTICLSWMNLLELGKSSDTQINSVKDFLEIALPNVLFIECNPFVVMDREEVLLGGVIPNEHLVIDAEMNRELLSRPRHVQSLNLFSIDNVFSDILDGSLVKRLESLQTTTVKFIRSQKRLVEEDPAHHKKVKNFLSQGRLPYDVRSSFQLICRSIFVDRNVSFEPNDACDFFHTIVPSTYCDFILIDSHWKDKVERAQREIIKRGLKTHHIAKAYSKKKQEVDRYMDELERFLC